MEDFASLEQAHRHRGGALPPQFLFFAPRFISPPTVFFIKSERLPYLLEI